MEQENKSWNEQIAEIKGEEKDWENDLSACMELLAEMGKTPTKAAPVGKERPSLQRSPDWQYEKYPWSVHTWYVVFYGETPTEAICRAYVSAHGYGELKPETNGIDEEACWQMLRVMGGAEIEYDRQNGYCVRPPGTQIVVFHWDQFWAIWKAYQEWHALDAEKETGCQSSEE